MALYTRRGYGPPKPNNTPKTPVPLDRFGLAIAGEYVKATAYTDDIPGLPININQGISTGSDSTSLRQARLALLGIPSPVSDYDNYTNASENQLKTIGARIIQLAQCAREADLCSEYLEYTTLPLDNNSGLFGTTWGNPGNLKRYIGDLKTIYDSTVASLPYTAPLFSEEDRNQYDHNPLIPFRLAYFIKAFLDTFYKVGQ